MKEERGEEDPRRKGEEKTRRKATVTGVRKAKEGDKKDGCRG